jgi:quercetin dioxygenase-like cupin family protein
VFEFSVAPGFDTGAHYHTKIEEIFYVLEGELTLRAGDRVVQGGAGTFVFVPIGPLIWEPRVKPSPDVAGHSAPRA